MLFFIAFQVKDLADCEKTSAGAAGCKSYRTKAGKPAWKKRAVILPTAAAVNLPQQQFPCLVPSFGLSVYL